MFVKQIVCEDRIKKPLEVGRSLEVKLLSGDTVTGIIDFISGAQSSHTIILNTTHEERCFIKIYSGRQLVELVTYTANSIDVRRITEITVTSNRKQEKLHTSQFDDLTYWTDGTGSKLVPIEVGEVIGKHSSDFRVLAISKNGNTMFVEDTITGGGMAINMKDETLISTFNNLHWGTPTR